ncbi:MAG: hypothetical protein KC468_28630, partial [Myxococcales bacterium]|nr:hypothetical protein [Myxococcales bacterium]
MFEYSEPPQGDDFAREPSAEPAPVDSIAETLFHPEALAVETNSGRNSGRDAGLERESHRQLIESGRAHPMVAAPVERRLEPDAPRLRRRGPSALVDID